MSDVTVTLMTTDEMGKSIALKLPNDIIFCTAWVDTKLDPNILKLKIADDGRSVKLMTKKPDPPKAKDMLSHYPWAKDPTNVVVVGLDAKLKKFKDTGNQWETKTLLQLDEEVIKKFVDIDGTQSNNITCKVDVDGRQRICFMLKTVNSHDAEAGNFVNCNNTSYVSPNNADGDESMCEETVGDVRAELDEKLNEMASHFNDHTINIQNKMQQHILEANASLKAEMVQGVRSMFAEMVLQMNKNGKQYDADEDQVPMANVQLLREIRGCICVWRIYYRQTCARDRIGPLRNLHTSS